MTLTSAPPPLLPLGLAAPTLGIYDIERKFFAAFFTNKSFTIIENQLVKNHISLNK